MASGWGGVCISSKVLRVCRAEHCRPPSVLTHQKEFMAYKFLPAELDGDLSQKYRAYLQSSLVSLLSALPFHCCRIPSLQHAHHFPTSFLRKGHYLSKTLNTALCYANVAHATLSYCCSCHSPRCLSQTLGHIQPSVSVGPERPVSACGQCQVSGCRFPKTPRTCSFPRCSSCSKSDCACLCLPSIICEMEK